MFGVDATTLALLMNPDARPPHDPSTGQPVARAKERVEHLVAELERNGETVLIPTPALAEVLVKAGDQGPALIDRVARSSRFRIGGFDLKSAVEHAAMTQEAIASGSKFGGSQEPWQKVKFDRQIIAIARSNGAKAIYSDDGNVATFAAAIGLRVIRTWELPLPPEPEPDLLSGLDPDHE